MRSADNAEGVCDGKRAATLDGLHADPFLGQREREGTGWPFMSPIRAKKKFING